MPKKNKANPETESRSLLPEEVQECSQKLAGLIEERRTIKRKQKESARAFKQQVDANEEEQERLSRMIITQQEEVPMQRQMTLAEIEDRRRHEVSIDEFNSETNAFNLGNSNGDHSSPELTSAAPTKPDGNTIEGGLYRALHRYQGGEKRWQKLRDSGASDAELKAAIGDVFGLGGGNSGPDMKSIAYKGGKQPAFYFDKHSAHGEPTLKGKALIEKAREVLAIPQRNGTKQPAPEPIAETGDVVEADPLDLVPDDKHKRNWSSLSDPELEKWKDRLLKYQALSGLAPDLQAENAAMLERVEAEIRRRDEAWSKAENERTEPDVKATGQKIARSTKARGAAKEATK